MKKLLNHMKSVYQIPQKIKGLTDHREKYLIGHEQVVMAVLILLMLQYESFHTVFSAPESMKKRLIRRLHQEHGHFADVIAADALYLNAPFLNTVLDCRMDAVIRLKDEKRCIFQDAEGLFQKGLGNGEGFRKGKTSVEVWDLSDFSIEGCEKKLRVVKFQEMMQGQKESRFIWLVTTLESAPPQVLWEMMHKRWDIEENAFHQLKTYYHAGHCYCHGATQVIFLLMLIAFNMRELYLYRRLKNFRERNITLKSVTRLFRDQLLLEDFRKLLYDDSG